MSVYERRFQIAYEGVNDYTDDAAVVLAAIERGEVRFVCLGHGEYEDVPEGPGRIGGTIVTRRTTAVLTPDEFVERYSKEAA